MSIIKQSHVDPLMFFRLGFFMSSAFMIGIVMVAFFYFFFETKQVPSPVLAETKVASVSKVSWPYEKIGSGCLSLNFNQTAHFASDLEHELFFLAKNKRPDFSSSSSLFILGLKNSKQYREILNGQTLFLSYESKKEEQEKYLSFSSEPTSFWIKPILLEQGNLMIEVFKEINDGESSLAKIEKTQFTLLENAAEFKRLVLNNEHREPSFVTLLRSARLWGYDMLIKEYGGETYQALKDKVKIEFYDQHSSYVCFVGPGDYLSWEEGKWKERKLEEISPNLPLARIRSFQGKELNVEIWDEQGFQMFFIALEKQAPSKLNVKLEQVITNVRHRTSSQLSCLMEKRRMVLKEGDWVLKTPLGWHIIKKSQEVIDLLEHRLSGELFVFDKIEKEEGILTIKGRLFDEKRTQIQHVMLPIKTESKAAKITKKRKLSYLGEKK